MEVAGAPAGVSGTRRVVIQRLPFDEVFTVWDEPRQFAWAMSGAWLPLLARMAESVPLQPTSTGCRLDLTQGLQDRRGLDPSRLGPVVGHLRYEEMARPLDAGLRRAFGVDALEGPVA